MKNLKRIPFLHLFLRHPFWFTFLVFAILQSSGFCWERFGWISDEELIANAIERRSKISAEIASDIDSETCCYVDRNTTPYDTKIGAFIDHLFCGKAWMVVVRTNYEIQNPNPEFTGKPYWGQKCGEITTFRW